MIATPPLSEADRQKIETLARAHERCDQTPYLGRCMFPYMHALLAAWRDLPLITTALNAKVQHEIDEHPDCGMPHVHDPRKDVLYERDRRLNEPPASYTFHDPNNADSKSENRP